jgi:membrane-associated protease RseP (regulator of RpoE activity)
VIGGITVLVGIIAMVMIHEAGHFIAAKATGMKATEFFFGFGPKLWSTQRGETEYGVKAFPLGGYVRIVGMNPYEEVPPEDEGRTYREKPFWAKSVVVLAGVASHFVVAFLLFWLVNSVVGVGTITTTIAEVSATVDGEPSPAAAAGLRPGDRIIAVDGVATPEWGDVTAEIADSPGETVVFTIERGEATITVEATLASVEDEAGGRRGLLGVTAATPTERLGPMEGFVEAGASIGDGVVMSAQGMWQLFTGIGDLITATIEGDRDTLDQVRPASPIGLVQIGAETQRFGFAFTLELIALFNIFIALLNLIPMYPFDGGHFVVAVYEKVRGRAPDVRKLAPIAAAVLLFFVLLGVLAIYLDIAEPFRLN